MKKKLRIIEQKENTAFANGLDFDDSINSIKENRERLRSSASMLQSIGGMLLSAGFLVFFFLIQEKLTKQAPGIYVLMFVAIVTLVLSMFSSLLSVHMRPLSPAATKGEKLELQIKIYKAEYTWSVASLIFLFIAILLFLAALIFFAVQFG